MSAEGLNPLTTGTFAIGRYEVTAKLGDGRSGAVYLARDPALERMVAIKLMRRDLEAGGLVDRFLHDAQLAASLRHPSIATVFESGDHGGQPFVVAEYVAGRSVGDLARRRPQAPIDRRLALIESLCDGLQHAHDAGVAHQGIKPSNLIVDGRGQVRILDFGAAALGSHTVTVPGAPGAAAMYLAPEQAGGLPGSRASDVFSIGLILYELLAGRPAFSGDDPAVVREAIIHAEPTPLSTVCSEAPDDLVAIVEKALQKDPRRRFDAIGDMGVALADVRASMASARAGRGRPTPAEGSTDRAGGREWFSDRLFVERQKGHDSTGFGVSIVTHLALLAIVLIVVFTMPMPPGVKEAEKLLMPGFLPTVPPVVADAPTRPKENVSPRPATTRTPEVLRATASTDDSDKAPLTAPPELPTGPAPPPNPFRDVGSGVVAGAFGTDTPLPPPPPLEVIDETPVNDVDRKPSFERRVLPQVPAGASGVVGVQVLVLRTGRVAQVRILDETPYSELIRAAAFQCTFKPAVKRLKPVTTWHTIFFELATKR